jgi:CARDB
LAVLVALCHDLQTKGMTTMFRSLLSPKKYQKHQYVNVVPLGTQSRRLYLEALEERAHPSIIPVTSFLGVDAQAMVQTLPHGNESVTHIARVQDPFSSFSDLSASTSAEVDDSTEFGNSAYSSVTTTAGVSWINDTEGMVTFVKRWDATAAGPVPGPYVGIAYFTSAGSFTFRFETNGGNGEVILTSSDPSATPIQGGGSFSSSEVSHQVDINWLSGGSIRAGGGGNLPFDESSGQTSVTVGWRIVEHEPDLIGIVGNIPEQVSQGQTVRSSLAVKNVGPVRATGTIGLSYYLSPNNTRQISDGDILVAASEGLAINLASDQSHTLSLDVQIPDSMQLGTYYLKAYVDSTDAIGETTEDNNVAVSSPLEIKPQPDIIIESISPTPDGNGVIIHYTIEGGLPFAPVDLFWSASGEHDLQVASFSADPAKNEHHIPKSLFSSPRPTNTFFDFTANYLVAVGDVSGAIPEKKEDNNSAKMDLVVRRPTVILVSPAQWLAGRDIDAYVLVSNPNPYPIYVKTDVLVVGDVFVKGLPGRSVALSGEVYDEVRWALPRHQISWEWIANKVPEPVTEALYSAAFSMLEEVSPGTKSLWRQWLSQYGTAIGAAWSVLEALQLELNNELTQSNLRRSASYHITTETGHENTQVSTQGIQLSIPEEAVGWYYEYLKGMRFAIYSGLAMLAVEHAYVIATGIIFVYEAQLFANYAYLNALAASGLGS